MLSRSLFTSSQHKQSNSLDTTYIKVMRAGNDTLGDQFIPKENKFDDTARLGKASEDT